MRDDAVRGSRNTSFWGAAIQSLEYDFNGINCPHEADGSLNAHGDAWQLGRHSMGAGPVTSMINVALAEGARLTPERQAPDLS